MKSVIFTSPHNRKFTATVINKGEQYGLSEIHDDDEPIVEFRDVTNATGDSKGQMVSQYFTSTILNHNSNAGLRLDGEFPEWDISAENIRSTQKLIRDY
jgi:hypothetical protein